MHDNLDVLLELLENNLETNVGFSLVLSVDLSDEVSREEEEEEVYPESLLSFISFETKDGLIPVVVLVFFTSVVDAAGALKVCPGSS